MATQFGISSFSINSLFFLASGHVSTQFLESLYLVVHFDTQDPLYKNWAVEVVSHWVQTVLESHLKQFEPHLEHFLSSLKNLSGQV